MPHLAFMVSRDFVRLKFPSPKTRTPLVYVNMSDVILKILRAVGSPLRAETLNIAHWTTGGRSDHIVQCETFYF